VAIIKSCSTIKPVLLELRKYLFITIAAVILCSESKKAEVSSIKLTFAFFPRALNPFSVTLLQKALGLPSRKKLGHLKA